MTTSANLDNIAITVHAHRLLRTLLNENPVLEKILLTAATREEALTAVRNWVLPKLKRNSAAERFYYSPKTNPELYELLNWEDFATIRILDYVDHAGEQYVDQNIHGEMAVSNPIKMLWMATNFGIGGAKPGFFMDMLQLFRQLNGSLPRDLPKKKEVLAWMKKYPSGIDSNIIELRKKNKERIINILLKKIDTGEITSPTYNFGTEMTLKQKREKMEEWWNESHFHLKFAVRSPDLLNEMLDYSLDPDTMKILYEAREKGIPFFVNPYYLSLLNVQTPEFAVGGDLAIRCYVVYSQQLVEEFGEIVAWEKEDKTEPGKPNAAGWILPSHNIHRRYPEVAIFIPDTVGRACGGLCASCQRMFDFQRGRLNFNLDKLKPDESWSERLPRLLDYFKDDSQLRDILLTGGDALMSHDNSLRQMLDEIYQMALRKINENKKRPEHEKYAEILRIRIGTRLPVYLPQRITPELGQILEGFRIKASKIGIQQFVIQTHFESPMEVTPEARRAVQVFLNAGWAVTNQLVFTTAASRRGHTAKLRKVLNDIGVLTYYTFTVKGFKENTASFAPNSRSVQEAMEEKVIGKIPGVEMDFAQSLMLDSKTIKSKIARLRDEYDLPFLATDRNILNLPGVGKSLTFRTIGITRYGRRILEFDHDRTRNHSPIINTMGKVIVIESKSIAEYLNQLEEMGEDRDDYRRIFGYSIGQTEARMPMYEYPEYEYEVTKEFTSLEI
ncbi:KamA family protein [Maribellus luteus]|uniref:KamA family protein n=1 Tax=Maribellus luteus TaxID=2305463 RepID=A0A399SYN4_9BACT|nr:KamA family protein [Maribellus luteus]RIJ49250.1 KamA family protein [Maribellus luteus]